MKNSPTQRSLAYARAQGWPVAIVEHWNPHAFIRQDLFGVIDLLVLDDEPGVLGVQACAGNSHATRRTKITDLLSEPDGSHPLALRKWLEKHNRLEVWSWSKKGARGKRKKWEIRRERIAPA